MKFNGNIFQGTVSVAVGTPQVVLANSAKPWSYAVNITAGTGHSALVECSFSSLDAIASGTATWFALNGGAVAASTFGGAQTPISALRCTATGVPCTLDFVQ